MSDGPGDAARLERTTRARPSLSGRIVEVQTALRLLRQEILAASRAQRKETNPGDNDEAWRPLEQAGGEVGAAEKSILDAALYVEAARTRGFMG